MELRARRRRPDRRAVFCPPPQVSRRGLYQRPEPPRGVGVRLPATWLDAAQPGSCCEAACSAGSQLHTNEARLHYFSTTANYCKLLLDYCKLLLDTASLLQITASLAGTTGGPAAARAAARARRRCWDAANNRSRLKVRWICHTLQPPPMNDLYSSHVLMCTAGIRFGLRPRSGSGKTMRGARRRRFLRWGASAMTTSLPVTSLPPDLP